MKTTDLNLSSILLFLLIIINSCGITVKPSNEKKKTLVVVLYDVSKSVDKYATLKEDHLRTLFYSIGAKGGGEFYGYLIKSSSSEQDPFIWTIPRLDTLVLNGNRYQVNNQRKINDQKKKVFEEAFKGFLISAKESLIVGKNQLFTDLQNAFELAKTTLEQSSFDSHKKELVIISDCLQDLPERSGLNNFEFPSNTEILVVRPSTKIELQELFPSNHVRKYVSINDAFLAL
jgi:hypothetical protein